MEESLEVCNPFSTENAGLISFVFGINSECRRVVTELAVLSPAQQNWMLCHEYWQPTQDQPPAGKQWSMVYGPMNATDYYFDEQVSQCGCSYVLVDE